MILPATYVSGLILLIGWFVCLGSWADLFELTGPRWRFELFYIDFAIGAILLSLACAYTFGVLGSDLAFTDRMLVAGRGSQVFLIASGCLFNLGNMLLLSSVPLLGMSAAFPIAIAVVVAVLSCFYFHSGNIATLAAG